MDVGLQAFYLGASAVILLVYSTRPLKDRFLAYGARNVSAKEHSRITPGRPNLLTHFLDYLATLQVPHSWFLSFYVTSVCSSVLWAHQLLTSGPLLNYVATRTTRKNESMSRAQVALCCSLVTLQGTRRLYECITLTKPTKSKMWITHWLIGILFYLATGVAVWIEGVPALTSPDSSSFIASFCTPGVWPWPWPWPLMLVLVMGFIWFSKRQHDIHVHLASLQKYSVPVHPSFDKIICPHYYEECKLYMCLELMATPPRAWVNWTMLCALIFVAVNLGITADVSKTWAVGTFGSERIKNKARIMPDVW